MRWRSRRTEEDFAQEIRAHLEAETERLIEDGMSPDAARDAARRAFGSVLTAQERFHASRRFVWLEQFRQDLRYAWRGVFRSRAFAATTVLTLAVVLSLTTVLRDTWAALGESTGIGTTGAHSDALLVRGRSLTDLRVDTAQKLLQPAHPNPLAFEVCRSATCAPARPCRRDGSSRASRLRAGPA